jgi:hypothetical protein
MKRCDERFSQDCLEFFDKRSIINIEENKRKYIVKNTNKKDFTLYKIDDCVIIDGQRCDFLLLNCDENGLVAYFIELKGADLLHAIRQIDTTLTSLLDDLKDYKVINVRIVLSKVNAPNLRSSEYIKLEKKIRKLGGTIKQQVRVLEEVV